MIGTKEIGKNIRWVRFYRNMCQADHTCSYRLTNPMLVNRIVILLDSDRGNGEIGNQTLIISHHLGWSINKNSDHSELVAHCHGQLRGNYHDQQL